MVYKASDIKVLSEIEHIRQSPGMYIGTTSDPVHLVEEAFDNALDECTAGYAKAVAINIDTKNHLYSVIDNGRGIPISNDVPKTISSKLFSGAKFKGSKTAYEICSGLHGVGLVAVNALSDLYTIEIYRQGKHAVFEFQNSRFKKKTITDFSGECPFATKITFKPDKDIFESLDADLGRLRRRMLIASIELPDCTFVLNIGNKKEVIRINKKEFFLQHCQNGDEISGVINTSVSDKVEKFAAMFCYSLDGAITPKTLSSVNLLPVEGGTHISIFYEILKDIFSAKAKKFGIRILPQDCFCGLRAYLSLSLLKPEFSGQTKDKLINRKSYLDELVKKLRLNLETYFNQNEEELQTILDHFEAYRKKVDSRKIKTANGKRASTKFTKLRDCSSRNGELFIVEGDSAGGGFIACRDPRLHAVLPLRGKIPSAVNAKDILKNKEIGELIESLGTGVGPTFDISKLRYSKIICATDADPDGQHISVLLTLVLATLVPEVIKQGFYYIAETPLYAINEKKTFIPLWTEQELEDAKKKNRHITRYKGLGELNPSQLKIVAIGDKTRRLIPVSYTKNIDKIIKLFIDPSEKRRLLEGKWKI